MDFEFLAIEVWSLICLVLRGSLGSADSKMPSGVENSSPRSLLLITSERGRTSVQFVLSAAAATSSSSSYDQTTKNIFT